MGWCRVARSVAIATARPLARHQAACCALCTPSIVYALGVPANALTRPSRLGRAMAGPGLHGLCLGPQHPPPLLTRRHPAHEHSTLRLHPQPSFRAPPRHLSRSAPRLVHFSLPQSFDLFALFAFSRPFRRPPLGLGSAAIFSSFVGSPPPPLPNAASRWRGSGRRPPATSSVATLLRQEELAATDHHIPAHRTAAPHSLKSRASFPLPPLTGTSPPTAYRQHCYPPQSCRRGRHLFVPPLPFHGGPPPSSPCWSPCSSPLTGSKVFRPAARP